MAKRQKYDWPKIKKEYRTGTYSDAELARRYGCSRRALQKHIENEGWEKDLSGEVRKSVQAKLVEEDAKVAREQVAGSTSKVAGSNAEDKSAVELAADTRVVVVRCHRKDVAKQRDIAYTLLAELEENKESLKLSERSSILRNIAQAAAKYIPLERQAFNLDADEPEDITGALTDLDRRARVASLVTLAKQRRDESGD